MTNKGGCFSSLFEQVVVYCLNGIDKICIKINIFKTSLILSCISGLMPKYGICTNIWNILSKSD